MLATLSQDLSQPEYLHVLINPLPVYGLGVAMVGLFIALVLRSRPAQIATLALVLGCSLSAWPVAHYGKEGYDRVLSMTDTQGGAWLKAHMHRADELVWVYYVMAALAAVAILVPLRWPKTATALALAVLLASGGALGVGGYIAYAGGKIRHREFRNEPAPIIPVEQDEH